MLAPAGSSRLGRRANWSRSLRVLSWVDAATDGSFVAEQFAVVLDGGQEPTNERMEPKHGPHQFHEYRHPIVVAGQVSDFVQEATALNVLRLLGPVCGH